MDLFSTFLVVSQFLRKWTNSPTLPSLFAAAPALVPGPSASALACRRRRCAGSCPWPVGVRPRLPPSSSRRLSSLSRRRPPLACRQRPLACRSRRAGSHPLPVSISPRLPSSSSPPPPTAADAPDRPSPSCCRASFSCFVCVVISRN